MKVSNRKAVTAVTAAFTAYLRIVSEHAIVYGNGNSNIAIIMNHSVSTEAYKTRITCRICKKLLNFPCEL